MRPAKTQLSLGIRPVWSESSLCTHWEAKDSSFLHAYSEDSDQTGRMPRLIWVFAGRTLILLVLSCRGSSRPCNVAITALFLFKTAFDDASDRDRNHFMMQWMIRLLIMKWRTIKMKSFIWKTRNLSPLSDKVNVFSYLRRRCRISTAPCLSLDSPICHFKNIIWATALKTRKCVCETLCPQPYACS